MSMIKTEIIRTNGERHEREIPKDQFFKALKHILQAEDFDTVNLRDENGQLTGKVMIVDDSGYEARMVDHGVHNDVRRFEAVPVATKPVNEEATKLYHQCCEPGVTHQIVGDVAIVNDSDWE